MSYLLLPGRQIVNTEYQERYIDSILGMDASALPEMMGDAPSGPITDIVFGITSSNKSNSRYNPLPLEVRSILVYEFCRRLRERHEFAFHIVGVPHYPPTVHFLEIVLKEIAEQTQDRLVLTPQNTILLTSTPPIIDTARSLGFAVLPGEYHVETKTFTDPTPSTVVRELGEMDRPLDSIAISQSARDVFRIFPEAVRQIRTLFNDPILTEQGDLTETRNYQTYARAMSDVIDLKYNEVKDFLLPGKIVDEGCADGVLIERIAVDFPDSDMIGIDLSAEMLARANEAKREGRYGGAFVFFKQQNLMSSVPDTQAKSVDTIICNSTLHELWSYGNGDETLRTYLRNKRKQLKSRGRLVVRDVVGPEHGDTQVYLECVATDGVATDDPWTADVTRLSTQSLFYRFLRDFRNGRYESDASKVEREGKTLFKLPLRLAMEFITKMSYTDNWASESHEEFCFWAFSDWERELADAGFKLLPGSRAYVNQWRVENRFKLRVSLWSLAGYPLDFPVTNMVLAGVVEETLP
jgi:SAM-dependent methyltransferase